MKTLLHFDSQGEKALGIWWVDRYGSPQNLYLDPESPMAARGRIVMFNKTNPNVPWELWFDRLADHAPYFEVWAAYDSMGFTPQQMLSALQPSPPLGLLA